MCCEFITLVVVSLVVCCLSFSFSFFSFLCFCGGCSGVGLEWCHCVVDVVLWWWCGGEEVQEGRRGGESVACLLGCMRRIYKYMRLHYISMVLCDVKRLPRKSSSTVLEMRWISESKALPPREYWFRWSDRRWRTKANPRLTGILSIAVHLWQESRFKKAGP